MSYMFLPYELFLDSLSLSGFWLLISVKQVSGNNKLERVLAKGFPLRADLGNKRRRVLKRVTYNTEVVIYVTNVLVSEILLALMGKHGPVQKLPHIMQLVCLTIFSHCPSS